MLSLPLEVACCVCNFLSSTEKENWNIQGCKGWRRTWFTKQSQLANDIQNFQQASQEEEACSFSLQGGRARIFAAIYSHVLWWHQERLERRLGHRVYILGQIPGVRVEWE